MFEYSFVFWASIVMQTGAGILALRIIPLTQYVAAWVILSLAFFFWAIHRVIIYVSASDVGALHWTREHSVEVINLLISILIVIALLLIRRIFIRQHHDEEQLQKLSLAVEQSPSSTVILDTRGVIEYINPAFTSITGYQADEIVGIKPDILKPDNSRITGINNLWDTVQAGDVWTGEVCNKSKNGDLRWEKASVSPVKNKLGETTHYVAVLEDVTRQKEQRDALEYLAMHDSLTGLANRNQFLKHLNKSIKTARKKKQTFAVMLMDLDNFKEINDALGHSTGDRVLREIGTRLDKVISSKECIARMGGDEFLILLSDASDEYCHKQVAKIKSVLKVPFILNNRNFEINASIGVAKFPDDGTDPDTLMQHADVAMYAAKTATTSFVRYDKNCDNTFTQLELSSELKTAVEQGQLFLNYQPQVDFRTGRLMRVEVLLRWNHPLRGLLFPETFIPLAEKTGYIRVLTQWVVQHALRQLSLWNKQGYDPGMSINISARDLIDRKWPGFIHRELEYYQIDPSRITLEITESALMMYTQQSMNVLNKLKSIGLNIAIDDFGTGYSSLQHLKELPVSELKIDKSFVIAMMENDNDAIIVHSTTGLAHNLGMNVVAEGIEDQDVYDILKVLGCDCAQGYHIGQPDTADAMVHFFAYK